MRSRTAPLLQRRRAASLAAAATLLAAFPFAPAPGRDLSAQLTGTVLDRASQPLEGATVEAWAGTTRLAARVTDADGRFSFSEPVASATGTLSASRLGFREVRVPVERAVRDYVLRLQEAPVAIPGLVVETEGNRCGEDEDALARALWEAARGRYRGGLDTLGVVTYMASAEAVVSRDDLGPLPLPEMALDQRGSSSLLRFSWRRQAERNGYAIRIIRTDSLRSFESWVYAPLEADFAPHFAEAAFGRLHRFHVVSEDEEGWTISFCPRRRNRADIEGRLRMAPDTTLVWAEWVFRTPDPVEEAGGRAVFPAPRVVADSPFLLPAEGMFWRKVPDGGYYARYQRYEGWLVAEGDSVPFLPERRTAEALRVRVQQR